MRLRRPSLAAGLTLVVATTSAQATDLPAGNDNSSSSALVFATFDGTGNFSCFPPPTVFYNVTTVVPTTTTSTTTASYFSTFTQPITIYQTIISTTVLTSIQFVTETETATSTTTATTVSPSPTTATATETTTATETDVTTAATTATTVTTATATDILSPYSVTEKATSLVICPTRIFNPSYTALGPYPTDWTWGCPPGWLCKPLQENCNFEFGLPDRSFLCAPNECVPAEVLPAQLPTWDDNIYGNATPAENPGLTFNAIDSYFNMAPGQFGLTYEIFVVDEVFTLTSTIRLAPSPTVGARQAQTSVPGACYPWCNNCLLEAQSKGKNAALCVPGSAFEVSLEQCEQCIQVHKSDNTGSFVQIAPQFQQFLDYCDQFSTVVVTTSVMATSTNDGGATTSSWSSVVSTTVTPKTSLPPPSSGPAVSTTTATVAPPVYTTTATLPSTLYSQSIVAGTQWSQVTIVMPTGVNRTTTLYGSELGTSATLILPASATTDIVTTMTVTGAPPTTATGSAVAPAVFTGAAASSQYRGDAARSSWMALWSGWVFVVLVICL